MSQPSPSHIRATAIQAVATATLRRLALSVLFTIATNSYQTTCTVSERTFNKRQHANARYRVGLSLFTHYDMANLTPKRIKMWLMAIWMMSCVAGTTFVLTGRHFSDSEYKSTLHGCIFYHTKRPALSITYPIIVMVLPLVIISVIHILIYQILRKNRLVNGN